MRRRTLDTLTGLAICLALALEVVWLGLLVFIAYRLRVMW